MGDQTNISRLNIRRDTMALTQRRGSTFATNQRRRSSDGGAGAFSSRTSFATSSGRGSYVNGYDYDNNGYDDNEDDMEVIPRNRSRTSVSFVADDDDRGSMESSL